MLDAKQETLARVENTSVSWLTYAAIGTVFGTLVVTSISWLIYTLYSLLR